MQLTSLRRLSAPVGLVAFLCCLSISLAASTVPAQSQTADQEREQLTAERFLNVLLKRPRPGTSLDRVYGYHVRNGSLDALLTALQMPEDQTRQGTEADAGSFNLEDADRGSAIMVLGLLQLQRGKSAAAVLALKQAEQFRDDDAACSYYLGKAHLAIGETELAAAAMERAIERGPARNEALPIFTELGRIYGRAGAMQKALNVWTRLEKQFPGDSRVGGQIATTLADEGNIQEALNRFETLSKSARKDEDKIAFAIQAAEMKRRLGQPEDATADLEKILGKLRPGSWLYTDVRNRIEDGFLKSGDVDALADYYQGRLTKDADNLELMTRLGRILVSAGRLEEARTTLMAAVERAPDDATVRLGLVDILVRQAKVAEAGEQYEQLAKQDPTNPDYLLKWGQLLLEDQKMELAERRKAAATIWQRLAEARNDDAVTLAQVADRLRSVDQSDEAIALYRKAIEMDSSAPQYREYLGEYLHQLDRKDEAIQVWKAIADGDRRNVGSLIRLAEIFATFKLPERSLETWKAASEFDLTFSQELRYASQLRAAKHFDAALSRLETAEGIAESPDERDQLLAERITTYSEAGTLPDKIAALEKLSAPDTGQLKELALMHQAAGQLTDAFVAIKAALSKEPENIAVLSVAAEVLERQNRFADSVKYYRQLASVDRRFQTNYLEKVAQLQVRLGLADEALSTSEELIQANPASTDTYLFAARTAFQLGRTDEGIEVLRRAMTVARRDNGPRKLLASEFAKQYRTDEAIDLYWQALDFESKLDNRIDIIRSLAPLYERRAEIETLLSRIEEIGAKDNDVRATQMMIAAANEAVQDYGSARQAIDRLLARQPRDVGLLETMVRLCDAANELEMAIEFQQRIVTLADTPENRYRLVNLQLDAGTIDIATALSQRMSMAKDPSRIMSMIQGAARRGDSKTAMLVAREAIKNDNSLWDVKLLLAQILLHETPGEAEETNTGEEGGADDQSRKVAKEKADPHDEAILLCEQVLAASFPLDQRPPTVKVSKSSSAQSSGRTEPRYWSQSAYQMARQYQLGQYARNNYGTQRAIQTVPVYGFGHAQVLAEAMTWVPQARSLSRNEMVEFLKDEFKEYVLHANLSKVTDPADIWKYQALLEIASNMVEGEIVVDPAAVKNANNRKRLISWRLFELAPREGSSAVIGSSQWRLRQAVACRLWQSKQDETKAAEDPEAKPPKMPGPLTESQLDHLVAHYDRTVDEIEKNPKRSRSELLSLTSVMRNEFQLAGKADIAAKYQPEPLADDASFKDVLAAIQFYLSLGETEEADSVLPRLLPAVRSAHASGAKISGLSGSSISGSLGSMTSGNADQIQFFKKHRLQLLDAIIAGHLQNKALSSRGRTSVSTGTLSVYRQSSSGGYRSTQVKGPLSSELIDQSLARELMALQKATDTDSEPSQAFRVDDEILDHLVTPLADAPAFELKSRAALAAFAYWWMEQPQRCYDILARLSEEYPDDVNLRIEQARLASELGNDREALDILNSFEPLDSKMLVRKEMAALNLAARVSDEERAAQAAERLFGMRMDTTTQLALSDQLRQLGMKDKAAAVLQRLRGGRRQDDRTSLQIAKSFLQAGDKEAAAEVAFQVLRNLNRSRNQQGNYEYYKRQAVELLKSANRLEPLIAMAKRRVDAAPKSVTARTELAELYTAAGKKEEADQLWAEITKDAPANPTQLMTQAKGLAQAGKHKEAVALYLKAFQKEPQLINNGYYDLRNAVQQAKAWDEMYTGMLKVPANRIPEYRIDEFIEGDYNNRSAEFSDAKMKFVIHVLESGSIGRSLYSILSKITDKQREQYPQIRKAIIRTVTDDAAFVVGSNIWSIRSYSSNGTVSGGVQPVVEFLAADKESRIEFEKAVKRQLSKTDSGEAYMARILQALVQLKIGGEEQVKVAAKEVLAVVKELENREAGTKDSSNRSSWNQRLPEDFVWQAGIIIEATEGIPDKPQFVVAFYESANPRQTPNGRSPQYGILHPMIRAYKSVGRSEDAVRCLLKSYHSINNSEQNQHNPGYGDYQDLQSWQWIAEQLQNCDAPFHALAIHRRALGDPSKFEKAKRWGGSRDKTPFEVGAKKAIASINEEAAVRFMQSQLSGLTSKTSDRQEIDLQMLPISAFEDIETAPGFLMAINEAKKSEDGVNSLKALSAALQQESERDNAHWSLTAAQLMIAATIEPENIGSLSAQLSTLLPSQKDIETSPTGKTPYLDCFAVALALSQSDHPDAKPAVEKLASMMTAIATAKSESSSVLVLEKRFGDPREAVDRLLTALESNTEGKTPNKDQVALALKIAVTSAKDKDWGASSRALKAALGHGPPLVGISTTTSGDAFAIANTRSSSNAPPPPDHTSELNAQVLELLSIYQQHLELEKTQDDSWKAANVSPQILTDADPIFAALLKIVIPQTKTPMVALYGREIASTRNYDRLGPMPTAMQPQSAAKTLAQVARLTGRIDDVSHWLAERIKTESLESATLRIQLALQKKNGSELTKAIDSFETILNDVLPGPDAEMASTVGSYSISSQMQTESFEKSRIVNSVLHAVWDVARQKDLKESPSAVSADRLLRRTIALIGSDRYTMNRHGQILSNLRSRSVQQAAVKGDQSLLSSILGGMTRSIAEQYAGSNPDSMAVAQKRTLQAILNRIIEEGSIAQSYGVVRQIIESHERVRPNYKSPEAATVMRAIAELPKEQQYPLLQKITLGDRNDAPVLHWMGFVRASEVPELVRRQTPDFEKHKLIPTSSEFVPIADTALMLVRIAADLGETDALIKLLKERSQDKLDTADLIAALALLTRDGEVALPQVSGTLEALLKKLSENKPTTDDRNLKFPELETVLVIQALNAGMTKQSANQFTQLLKTYSVRAQHNEMTAAIGSLRAQAGFGRTGGGSAASPLKHFVPVSVPWYGDPEAPNLQPLHTATPEGWVSSTGGYNVNLLMLRYPVTGSFTMSAQIKDGAWGEADVSYGGVLYQPAGWNKTASINLLRGSHEVSVPVENIEPGNVNNEALKVTPANITGLCNDVPYLNDRIASSHPWPAVTQYSYRTTQWKSFQITGQAVIPREVHLLDSMMRGWGTPSNARFLPSPLLPTEEGKMADEPVDPAPNVYQFADGELKFDALNLSGQFDQGDRLQYIRPLLEKEELTWQFFWKKGETEVHPMLGRVIFKLTDLGTRPQYTAAPGDLSTTTFTPAVDLEPELKLLAPDVTPKDDEWNTLSMLRSEDAVQIQLNGQTIAELPVTNQTARPGFYREPERSSQIKDMILTGDWPEVLPDNLMEKAE